MEKIRSCFCHIQELYRQAKRRFYEFRKENWKDTGRLPYWAAVLLFALCAGLMSTYSDPNYGAGNMGREENPGHTIAQWDYGMPVLAAALAVLCCGDGSGPARREYSKSRCFCRGIQLNPAIAAQKLVGAVLP